MLEGWKCLECGVVYAPFVKACRCSVKIQNNYEQVTCLHEWPGPDTPCINCGLVISTVQQACFHNWPEMGPECTKCGLRFVGGITFTTPVPTICQHIYGEQLTAGRFCTLCGMQEVRWEQPGNMCKVTVSDLPEGTIGSSNG